MKRLFTLLLASAMVFGGVACSEDAENDARELADDAEDAAGRAADEAEDAAKKAADRAEDMANDETVDIDDNAFEPDELTIERGQEVTWVNQDDVEHTVTADDGAFESDELGEGDEFSHRFAEKGTYDYHCEIHGDAMSGTVTVED